MINLVTGLPGNGKTLFCLAFVHQLAKNDNRPVFYSGIQLTELGMQLLGWTFVEAEQWHTVPAGSIIVIDEAQRVFRPRSHGKQVPPHVEALETHRHDGLDLFLITQHPMLIDNEVRRLAGNHRHIVRKFGMQTATVHEWIGEVRSDCDKPGRRDDSIRHSWAYDKSVYNWYKSAELHTVKRTIPMRVWLLFTVPLLLIAAVWYMFNFSRNYMKTSAAPRPETGAIAAVAAPSSGSAPAVSSSTKQAVLDPVADARQYAFEHQERYQGLPFTAPRYDEVMRPVRAPVPVACVSSNSKCTCYSQQGTAMSVGESLCKDIVQHGYFVDFDDGSSKRDHVLAAAKADAVPVSAVNGKLLDNSVRVLGDENGYGVLGKRGKGS